MPSLVNVLAYAAVNGAGPDDDVTEPLRLLVEDQAWSLVAAAMKTLVGSWAPHRLAAMMLSVAEPWSPAASRLLELMPTDTAVVYLLMLSETELACLCPNLGVDWVTRLFHAGDDGVKATLVKRCPKVLAPLAALTWVTDTHPDPVALFETDADLAVAAVGAGRRLMAVDHFGLAAAVKNSPSWAFLLACEAERIDTAGVATLLLCQLSEPAVHAAAAADWVDLYVAIGGLRKGVPIGMSRWLAEVTAAPPASELTVAEMADRVSRLLPVRGLAELIRAWPAAQAAAFYLEAVARFDVGAQIIGTLIRALVPTMCLFVPRDRTAAALFQSSALACSAELWASVAGRTGPELWSLLPSWAGSVDELLAVIDQVRS